MQPDDPLLHTPITGVDPATLLSPDQCNQLQQHALEAYPNECVGYVKDGQYRRLQNVAVESGRIAEISADDMLMLMTEDVDLVCHSHPDAQNCPSSADMRLQMQMDIPHALIATNGQACADPVFFGRMMQRQPLVGRTYIHGVQDCFGVGLDFYSLVMGIELDDFPRDWEWWEPHKECGEGLYLEHFRRWGFRESDDELRIGDVFLLKAGRTVVPNHCGIYVGDHLMLHHLAGREEYDPSRLSTVEPLVRWRQHGRIEKVLRHGG